jgi:hypothetical protein
LLYYNSIVQRSLNTDYSKSTVSSYMNPYRHKSAVFIYLNSLALRIVWPLVQVIQSAYADMIFSRVGVLCVTYVDD